MAMLKVVEILAESDKNWEDAARLALSQANKTVTHIKSIYTSKILRQRSGLTLLKITVSTPR